MVFTLFVVALPNWTS